MAENDDRLALAIAGVLDLASRNQSSYVVQHRIGEVVVPTETADNLIRLAEAQGRAQVLVERAKYVEPIRNALGIQSAVAMASMAIGLFICDRASWDWRVCVAVILSPLPLVGVVTWKLLPKGASPGP